MIVRRRENLRRARTLSNSARSAALVISVTRPAAAASINFRGDPVQRRPETTTLVSATTRTVGSPLGPGGLDLGFYLRLGQRRFNGRQAVGSLQKPFNLPAA